MVLGGWRAWMRWWVRSEWRRGFPRSDLDGGGSSGRFFAGGMGCGGLGLPAARGGCYARPRRHGGGGGGACRPDFAFFWPAAQVWGPGPAWLRSWLWVAAARWLCRAGSMAARRVDWGGGWISGVSSSIGGPFRPSALSSSSGCYLRRRMDRGSQIAINRGSQVDIMAEDFAKGNADVNHQHKLFLVSS
ncbi:uncharacterized protein LOC119365211 [Triticum dicoccoides]|uniref:uncharacterized protein LOC119365211 n=1 Tax=Triticum dicoccoides TaxID=85692 RepID=UPI00188E913A|nr:uncharacterized protein LOC119365211 [Triticum dicoccoides]XP_044325574.1 uncharacterized protein LOC123046315 [Triticum aestivum]